jgi:hypothetical protein
MDEVDNMDTGMDKEYRLMIAVDSFLLWAGGF